MRRVSDHRSARLRPAAVVADLRPYGPSTRCLGTLMPSPPAPADAKRAMRARAREARAAIPDAERAAAADRLWRALLPLRIDRPPGAVAGFHPIGSEIDVLPVLAGFAGAGWTTALPVTDGPARPLSFGAWQPGDPLDPGRYGVACPPAGSPAVVPQLLLVPLLAFDRQGYRLGYGGGYYDRTLAALRRSSPAVLAVGVAFAEQEVETVPADDRDQRLDAIVTPRALIVV